MDYILKDLISAGKTAAAMEVVTRALQAYPAEEPLLFKKAFQDTGHLAITTGQDATLNSYVYRACSPQMHHGWLMLRGLSTFLPSQAYQG